ncbi:MAG TPA: DUF488 domain-containing protein [Candidatus Eisenbacteria bacterium]|nr:DUF488 domain-containing protein [Candidatus Eisenbacteria bacterium]
MAEGLSQQAREPRRLWTVGHGAVPLDDLIALLHAAEIRGVADVRRFPQSRRHPHFNRGRLAEALPAAGIDYRSMTELGGRRDPDGSDTNAAITDPAFRGYADYMQTAQFAVALENLLAVARERRTAVMCAESKPEQCHRSLIADALVARGIAVVHLLHGGALAEHVPSARVKVAKGRVTYPDRQGGLWNQRR